MAWGRWENGVFIPAGGDRRATDKPGDGEEVVRAQRHLNENERATMAHGFAVGKAAILGAASPSPPASPSSRVDGALAERLGEIEMRHRESMEFWREVGVEPELIADHGYLVSQVRALLDEKERG